MVLTHLKDKKKTQSHAATHFVFFIHAYLGLTLESIQQAIIYCRSSPCLLTRSQLRDGGRGVCADRCATAGSSTADVGNWFLL